MNKAEVLQAYKETIHCMNETQLCEEFDRMVQWLREYSTVRKRKESDRYKRIDSHSIIIFG